MFSAEQRLYINTQTCPYAIVRTYEIQAYTHVDMRFQGRRLRGKEGDGLSKLLGGGDGAAYTPKNLFHKY